MKTIELLAPAGNLEIFKAVIDAGADAVYFGGKQFSARAYANNFDLDESKKALDYAHLHNKKAYLTLNTLVKNEEFNKELFDYINFYYENGIDGVIVQDIGVIKYIRDNYNDLNIHGSTQMAICNYEGASFLKEIGLTRIVTARELSLSEINTIHNNTDIELEVFVHGALCYCYSGDCLFSSLAGGRSGNRGRCAQPCRLEYDVYEDNKIINNKGKYILSLKDLCAINELDMLIKCGVSSIKIEGRMKQKQYAANVVNIYRKYIDMLMDNKVSNKDQFNVKKSDKLKLYDLGNRCGFTNSYYYGNTDDMVTFVKPSMHSKDISYEYTEDKIQVKCFFTAHINGPIKLKLQYNDFYVEYSGIICNAASNRPVTANDIKKRLKKTNNTSFLLSEINIDIDDNIFIPLGEINRLRKRALENLQVKILKKYNRKKNTNPTTANYSKNFNNKRISKNNNKEISELIISVSNKEQLEAIIDFFNKQDQLYKYDLVVPMHYYELYSDIIKIRDELSCVNLLCELPTVIRESTHKLLEDNIDKLNRYDGVIVGGYDAYNFSKKYLHGIIITSDYLYTYNDYAVDLINLIADRNIAPLELNKGELYHRNNYNSILTIYGKAPMMISSNCINKNCNICDHTGRQLTIKDKKGHVFMVRNFCKMCYNIIYNELPTNIISEYNKIIDMNFTGFKINFVDEDYDMSNDILTQYKDFFINPITDKDIRITLSSYNGQRFTKGHFNRGVL